MIAAKTTDRPADRQYGYDFGCEGVVTRENAMQLLDCAKSTLYRLCAAGVVRRGKLGPRARFCKRSILEHLRSLES